MEIYGNSDLNYIAINFKVMRIISLAILILFNVFFLLLKPQISDTIIIFCISTIIFLFVFFTIFWKYLAIDINKQILSYRGYFGKKHNIDLSNDINVVIHIKIYMRETKFNKRQVVFSAVFLKATTKLIKIDTYDLNYALVKMKGSEFFDFITSNFVHKIKNIDKLE
ncbi:MAG: hypothetical protein KJ971_07415 [Firmicutes bacterium]|nr:hypothetical protein [Bacillota bacterium]